MSTAVSDSLDHLSDVVALAQDAPPCRPPGTLVRHLQHLRAVKFTLSRKNPYSSIAVTVSPFNRKYLPQQVRPCLLEVAWGLLAWPL